MTQPFPDAGTTSTIGARIDTNIVIQGNVVDLSSPLNDQHAACITLAPVLNASGHWEFSNGFSIVRATFEHPDLGVIEIENNPLLPSIGTTVSDSPTEATLPGKCKVALFLIVNIGGMKLANQRPIVIESEITNWPPVDHIYVATGDPVEFHPIDDKGEFTGAKTMGGLVVNLGIAKVFGSRISLSSSTSS